MTKLHVLGEGAVAL